MSFSVCKKNNFNSSIKPWCHNFGHYFFAFLSLFIILVLIYSNSFSGEWLFDDNRNVFSNKNIEMTSLTWEEAAKTFYGRDQARTKISRPFSYLTFGLNYLAGGYGVFGYHVVNFIIHYLTGVFLFLFLFNTLKLPIIKAHYKDRAYGIALLSALFWATHPIHVSAVTYIVQRMAILAALFSIMAMCFYLKARMANVLKTRIFFFVLCFLSAVLSFASKENGAMLPVSLWLFDLFLIQGISVTTLKKNITIIAVPLVLLMIWATFSGYADSILGGYGNRPFNLAERLYTEPRVLIKYISLLIYPLESRLTMFHDIGVSTGLFTPWTTLLAILIVVGLILVGLFLSSRRPLPAYCLVFFLVNHLIEGSIIPLELIYEHRNYLPSLLFFVLPALLMVRILDFFAYRKPLRNLMAVAFACLLAAQAHTTYARNRIFNNEFLFWQDVITKAPGLSRPHNNLGTYLWNRGYDDLSFEQFSLAIKLNNSASLKEPAIYHENIAFYHLKKKEHQQALKHLLESSRTQINPTARTLYGLSLALQSMGNHDKARFFIEKALEMTPDKDELHELLSRIKKSQAAVKQNLPSKQ
jgi:tetratricopeptide (TPR) repeat protein